MTGRLASALRALMVLLVLLASLGAARDVRLVGAAKHQNWEEVRALLKQHADVNASQGDGATALHWAVYWDDSGAADLLIRLGANVNAANELGVTPLFLACANGNGIIVANLLKAGADPNAASSTGVSPLMVAARTGRADAVKALLAHGADVNAKEGSRGQTALIWAVAQRHSDVVSALIEHGADVEVRTRVSHVVVNRGGPDGSTDDAPYVGEVEQGGSTPLLFAARQGDLASARILLAAGADVNEKAPDGYSVMLLASHSGHGALASFLLEKGADPNAADAGFTTLHTAVLTGDLDLALALLAHGANPNAQVTKATPIRSRGEDLALPAPLVGATPFFLAAKFADVPMMRALAAAGAEPKIPVQDGTTPLMVAAGADWFPATNRRGINVTANKSAASDPHEDEIRTLEAVRLAVDLGADVNAANEAGDTALFGAVSKGFKTVVKFLAEHRARLDVKDKLGTTLLMLTSPRATATRTSGTPASMFEATAAFLRESGVKE
jgi:ankyrin repeat protein